MFQPAGLSCAAASLAGAFVCLMNICAAMMPTSYRMHIGIASASCEITSGGVTTAETLSNRAMRADAMAALAQVREGAPLASALSGKKRFPGLLAMFARLGEQTGQLPVMLQRAADQLGTEVQRRALAMATILEPLLIVTMGAVVMLIVLAVLLPIIQLNTWVK